jgi:integrase
MDRAGIILKKCSTEWHKPGSNKACAAGECQHTCPESKIRQCDHAWTLRYWVNGKQKEKSFKDVIGANARRTAGSGEKLAKDFRLKLAAGKREQGRTFIDHGRSGRENFGEACAEYVARLAVGESSRGAYTSCLNRWVRPAFGHMTTAQAAVAHDEVEKLLNVSMAHLTVNRRVVARLLITGTLDKAVRSGKIAGHRITGIEIAETGDADAEERAPFIFPTFAQVEYLAREIGISVWLMRECGLRICEALAVEKKDFRLTEDGHRMLRVAGQASKDGRRRVPLKRRKKGEYRDVPVPTALWERVKDLPEGPLCPGRDGRRYMVYGTVWCQFRRFVPKAGIPAAFHPHSLRHVFASVMLGQGVDITEVAKWLGHRDINVTYSIYGHLMPSAADRAVAALDAEYEAWKAAGMAKAA